MRLFVAVYPARDATDDFAAFLDTLAVGRAAGQGVNARVAARENWHVTLAFLGEVPDTRRADVESAVGGAVDAWRTGTAPRLRMAGGGRFGRGRFVVMWVGLAGDVDPLRSLADRVRRGLRRARLPFDAKPFRPHLTVARPGDRLGVEALAADLAALRAYDGPLWTATEVRLVRSHLGPKPSYDHLAGWPLAGTTDPGHTNGHRPA